MNKIMMLVVVLGVGFMVAMPSAKADSGQRLAYKLVEKVYEESESTVEHLITIADNWDTFGKFPEVASERLARYVNRLKGFVTPFQVILDLQKEEHQLLLSVEDLRVLDAIVLDLTTSINLLRTQEKKIDEIPMTKGALRIQVASESQVVVFAKDTMISIRERLKGIIAK